MELTGDEEKILVLFSDLRVDDECIAPRFKVLWNRVETAVIHPRRKRSFSLAWAAVLILGVASVVWWSTAWQRPPSSPAVLSNALTTVKTSPNSSVQNTSVQPHDVVRPKLSSLSRAHLLAKKAAARRQAEGVAANQKTLADAKSISKWESPTAVLMQSSTDEVLSTLPQLNENASQLKSFLPSRSN
jgi:4-amino-4-deoxy-L-arabinose transferase-like glycosyltransferase